MNKFALLMAGAAYFIVGGFVSFYWDSQNASFLAIVAAGYAYFHFSRNEADDRGVHKRFYAMELAPLAEALNQNITSGFYGDSQWTMHESSNLTRGYLHFTICWNETWTAEAMPKRNGAAFKTGHLEIRFDDITEQVDKPKTSALFLFQDNSAFSASHFNHIIEKTMERADFFLKHEKNTMSQAQLSELTIRENN